MTEIQITKTNGSQAMIDRPSETLFRKLEHWNFGFVSNFVLRVSNLVNGITQKAIIHSEATK